MDMGFCDMSSKYPGHMMSNLMSECKEHVFHGFVPVPEDIEEQLQKCPGLRKVIIVPFTDETRAVKMCACVIPRSADVDTIEAVKEYIFYQFGITLPRKSERKTSWTSTLSNDYDPHMPSYIIFLESYPMTASGQVNRNLLAYMVSQIM